VSLGGLGGAVTTPSLKGHRMPPRITQESCSPRVSDRTMVGTVPSGSCLQGVRVERQRTAMKPTAISSHSAASCLQRGHAWASCAPAELASASPTASHFAVTGPKSSRLRRAQVASSPDRAGCQETISLSGQGEVFLLDIPSYRTRLLHVSTPVNSRVLMKIWDCCPDDPQMRNSYASCGGVSRRRTLFHAARENHFPQVDPRFAGVRER